MAGVGEHDHASESAPARRKRVVALAERLVRWSPRAHQPHEADAIEAFNRGVRLSAMGDRDAAVVAYRASIALGEGGVAAQAAFNLAGLWPDDLEAAASAYLAALGTEHPEVAPKAAYNLGSLLVADGDFAGATVMLQRALRFGHEDVSARAALKLESLRAEVFIGRLAAKSSVAVRSAASRVAPRSASSRRRSQPARWHVDRSRLRGSH